MVLSVLFSVLLYRPSRQRIYINFREDMLPRYEVYLRSVWSDGEWRNQHPSDLPSAHKVYLPLLPSTMASSSDLTSAQGFLHPPSIELTLDQQRFRIEQLGKAGRLIRDKLRDSAVSGRSSAYVSIRSLGSPGTKHIRRDEFLARLAEDP